MIDVQELLFRLATERPIFHSEADFQHALAWAIHRQYPEAQVRLELPVASVSGAMHVDLWIGWPGKHVAVELKYKTRAMAVEYAGELFSLKGHSAQDLGRYDFLKDIVRLELLTASRPSLTGYAILLTNDSSYWSSPTSGRTVDAQFRLHQGRQCTGTLSWGTGASPGTIRNRETPLCLDGAYHLAWQDYSRLPVRSYAVFRALVVQVDQLASNKRLAE